MNSKHLSRPDPLDPFYQSSERSANPTPQPPLHSANPDVTTTFEIFTFLKFGKYRHGFRIAERLVCILRFWGIKG